jgi:hypothetical protein
MMKRNPKLGKVGRTHRGFEIIEFTDRYAVPCSLQASSLAEYQTPGISAVWLGPNDADPKVMASQASAFGVKTKETTGWVPYPIPEGVSLNTRAHLDRKQVKALLGHLVAWLYTGSFAPKTKGRGR